MLRLLFFYQDKLLLVRIGYAHKKWVLPGGSIKRGEESMQTAVREIQEESGVVVTNLIYVGQRLYTTQSKKVTVSYYAATVTNDNLIIDGQEIIDAAWFSRLITD